MNCEAGKRSAKAEGSSDCVSCDSYQTSDSGSSKCRCKNSFKNVTADNLDESCVCGPGYELIDGDCSLCLTGYFKVRSYESRDDKLRYCELELQASYAGAFVSDVSVAFSGAISDTDNVTSHGTRYTRSRLHPTLRACPVAQMPSREQQVA